MNSLPDSQHDVPALRALNGQSVEPAPVGLFLWGFEFAWRVAGMPAWQLALGTRDAWRKSYRALMERYQPDMLWYNGMGAVSQEPRLLREDDRYWYLEKEKRDYTMDKISYSMNHIPRPEAAARKKPPIIIQTREDADQRIPIYQGIEPPYRDGLRELIRDYGARTLVLPHTCPAYIRACYTFGMERAMELMMADPDLFVYVCDRLAAADRRRMEEFAAAGARAVFVADAWGSCDMISPAMVERFSLPYQMSITQAAHDAGLKVLLWDEGDILPVLKIKARVPVDAFGIEQPRKGADLTVDKVRRAFGPQRCLLGNLDSEILLKQNDSQAIRRAVDQQMRQSGRGAPFILSFGSPIPSDVPPEAVEAVFEAARTFHW